MKEIGALLSPSHWGAGLLKTMHGEAAVLDPWQIDVLDSTSRRLILNCCRQSGKSTVAALLALHTALFRPGSMVLVISASLRQSGELFRKIADFIECLPTLPDLVEDQKLSATFETGSRIVSLPSSEATVRGFSAVSLLIEDESSRVSDALWTATRPMLAVSGGRHILMSTPFGQRGHFFDIWTKGGPEWLKIEIPASKCSRISQEFLNEEKASLGSWMFKQEYLCQFVETENQLFSNAVIESMFSDDILPLFGGQAVARRPVLLSDQPALNLGAEEESA